MERKYFDASGKEVKTGEYVLTAIPQEDKSVSYWLAKKDYIFAMYCFTIGHGGYPLNFQLAHMKGYIELYQFKFENFETTSPVIDVDKKQMAGGIK